jgi:hypothetical protein
VRSLTLHIDAHLQRHDRDQRAWRQHRRELAAEEERCAADIHRLLRGDGGATRALQVRGGHAAAAAAGPGRGPGALAGVLDSVFAAYASRSPESDGAGPPGRLAFF